MQRESRTTGQADQEIASLDFAMSPRIIAAAVSVGILLRLVNYFLYRSLWFDEAAIAINIIERPVSGFFGSLEFHQGAPLGFLVFEKEITYLLGPGELALRLFALICGLSIVVLAFFVARLYLSPPAVPLAVILVALNPSLIYFSSQVKQYSSDACISLLLLLLFAEMLRSNLGAKATAGFALAGAVALWFSHPAVFLLAGASIVLLVSGRFDKSRMARLIFIIAVWLTSFGALYFVSLRSLSGDRVLLDFWAQYFPPHPVASFRTIAWLFDAFLVSFRDPVGLAIIPGLAFFLIGVVGLFRRNWAQCGVLCGSLPAVTVAAILRRYPLGTRFLVFVIPVLLLLVSEGVATVCVRLPIRRLAYIAITCCLLFQPVLYSARIMKDDADEIRPVLRWARSQALPSDRWYVYFQAQPQMRYYSRLLGLRGNWTLGSDCAIDSRCYDRDIKSFAGSPRVWIVMSHMLVRKNGNDASILMQELDSKGQRVEEFRAPGARAYLYNFSALAPAN